jgi:hypothetical protein
VEASRDRERAATLALQQERAMSVALTAQMATTQRLLLGHGGTRAGLHARATSATAQGPKF